MAQSQCVGCHAGCCRSFAVPVTGADVLRIERDLNLTFWDFGCRWADPEGKIARKYAPHFFFSDEPQTPFVICLRHEASATFPDTTKCRFLVETPPTAEKPLGQGSCGIHPSRPSACRAFPTKFNVTGDLAVIHDVPPQGRENLPVYSLCARQWKPEEIDPLQAPQDLAVAKYEMDFFRSIAAIWNRVPRPFAVFPEFLRLVYQNRVMREPDAAPVAAEPAAQILPFAKAARRAA